MQTAVRFAAHNLHKKCWNRGQMSAYLKTCCIKEKVIDHLWQECGVNGTNVENKYMPEVWKSGTKVDAWVDVACIKYSTELLLT